jgi:hypothetical protein
MLIVFPLQQLLRKRAKTLHLYVHCLSCFCVPQCTVQFHGPLCEQKTFVIRAPRMTEGCPRWNLSNANDATESGIAGSRKDELPG